ncbi:hypothetical protein ANANG_G00216020 [Anguilla anguilla]|uniref:Plakophilin 1b n=1 Tax=Anguilla anguilla TaxID=7936 RepID=A0A9D3M379_ANGAN|nr:hypothetical protein ANANG_G00216020 [Anguilla anguilla]
MTLEPLRSAMTFENVEDTSLALPSDTNLRSGQQRVLDQVHTIKRGRSKKSGSLSPTSPQNNAEVSEFRSFRFTPAKLNGTIYSRSNSIATAGFVRTGTQVQQNRTMSAKSLSRRHASSSSQWEQRFTPVGPSNGFVIPTPARCTPAAATRSWGPSATQFIAGPVRAVRPPSALSNGEIKMATAKATKSENIVTTDGGSIPDITMKEAVEFLSSAQDSYQLRGASYIQHSTFKEDRAKQEVYQLNGIPALVSLLQSSNGQVQQTAAAALRNAVFRHAANKQEVHRCGGIADALALLPNTGSTETQKQLSGLLWNLSSADGLKPDLIKSALPVLTENIVVPFTCWSEGCASNNVDPEVFYNATGCLRNLSCAKEAERQAMRTCRGLIDSLVTYVQSCVSEDIPDDKSVENCMCILHKSGGGGNSAMSQHPAQVLPHQLLQPQEQQPAPGRQQEVRVRPASPTRLLQPQESSSTRLEQENVFNFPLLEDSNPKGLGWLFHSKTMQTYLSLLGSSQKDATLEACAGALQNLTANKGPVSTVMSQTIVHKLNGLPEIIPLLQSSSPSLQKTAVSLR